MNDKEKSPGAGDAPADPLFRAVFDQSKDGIFIETPEGEILDANRAVTELLGYSREELLKMRVSDLVPPEVAAELSPTIRPESVAPGAYVETVEVARDGTRIPVEVSNSLVEIEGEERVIAVIRDISERKRAEEALRRSEEKYRGIFEESVSAIYLFDAEKNFIDSNQAGIDLLGYPREELLRMSIPDVDADPEAVLPAHRELLSGGRLVGYEHRLRRKDGEVITVLNNSRPLTDAGGKVVGMLSTLLDITERKQVEEALRESEERFARAFKTAPYAIAITRPETGEFVEINDAFTTVTGYTREEAMASSSLGLNIWENPEDRAAVVRDLREGREVLGREYRFRKKDGTLIHGLFSVQPLTLGGESFLISSVNDITPRRKAEREKERLGVELARARKLEALGRLAGGIAHDFNNMLTAILGTAELSLRQVSPKSPLRSALEEIRRVGKRTADLTHRLMAFASKQEVAPRVLGLNRAVEGTLKMLRRLIGEDIELDWRPAPKLWKVRMDESQVDQVLVNLCVNARDALPSGGRLTIETANVSRPGGPAPGDYVRLTVGDDGEGMDEETLEHLFEPFYTTKEPGRGVGLGMATVYGIVTQNRGLIEVESEPGRGTTVIVHLPRYTGEMEVEPEIEEEARDHRGGETVLLVEDEKSILSVLERELADRGYTVLAFSDPRQALRRAGEYPGEIHLLVTDMVMPGMNGRELATRFAALRPAAGRLLVSGHSEVIAAAGDLEPGLHFLPKPLTGPLLAARIRQILDEKKGSVI